MESKRNTQSFTIDEKKLMLNKLNEAVVFESFLGTKFLGQKRFSLEGAEALIPALMLLSKRVRNWVLKNLLSAWPPRQAERADNIMEKPYKEFFRI